MTIIYLAPKTKRGSRVLSRHGRTWELVTEAQQVSFSARPGPWLQLVPRPERPQRTLWVNANMDKDFRVLHVETLTY